MRVKRAYPECKSRRGRKRSNSGLGPLDGTRDGLPMISARELCATPEEQTRFVAIRGCGMSLRPCQKNSPRSKLISVLT